MALAPGVAWFDAGELAAAAVEPGVPHPTGFPTFLLAGHTLGRLPLANGALRVHLLGALAAVCAAWLWRRALAEWQENASTNEDGRGRLGAQLGQCVLSAALLLLASGVGTNITEHFLQPIVVRADLFFGWKVDPQIYQWFVFLSSSALVIALVVFCCNATNLMDGLDGLCGGVTAIIAAGFLFLAVHLAMYGGGANTNWDALRVVLGLALLGAVLAFSCVVNLLTLTVSIYMLQVYDRVLTSQSGHTLVYLTIMAQVPLELTTSSDFHRTGKQIAPPVRNHQVADRVFEILRESPAHCNAGEHEQHGRYRRHS